MLTVWGKFSAGLGPNGFSDLMFLHQYKNPPTQFFAQNRPLYTELNLSCSSLWCTFTHTRQKILVKQGKIIALRSGWLFVKKWVRYLWTLWLHSIPTFPRLIVKPLSLYISTGTQLWSEGPPLAWQFLTTVFKLWNLSHTSVVAFKIAIS